MVSAEGEIGGTSSDDSLYAAFSSQLTASGLVVRRDGECAVALVALTPDLQNSWVALFEAGGGDYTSVTLNNGAHFWDQEWSDEGREEAARLYAPSCLSTLLGEVIIADT